jgi:hypothetical protein
MSFKAVQKKLKEYGKKSKKDTGLDFIEYRLELELESELDERERLPTPNPQLEEEYQLPQLKPPTLYNECYIQLQELAPKIQAASLSSPTYKNYSITI